MNNKVFVATSAIGTRELEDVRVRIEQEDFFDRYGEAYLSVKYGHFGFATVVPQARLGKRNPRWFWRMMRCSYVFFRRGWIKDPIAYRAFSWATYFGKTIIFEEDSL